MATSNRANNDKMLVSVASPSPMIAPVPETHEVRAPPPAQACVHSDAGRDGRARRARGCADGVSGSETGRVGSCLGRASVASTDRYCSSLSAEEAHEDLRHGNLGCCAQPPCRQRRLHSSLGTQVRQLLMLLGRGTVCTVRERRKCVQFLLWCQHFP